MPRVSHSWVIGLISLISPSPKYAMASAAAAAAKNFTISFQSLANSVPMNTAARPASIR